MESAEQLAQDDKGQKQRRLFIRQLNWRMMVVRVLVNAITLIVVVLLVPNINFEDRFYGSILFLAAILGLLNAFVKPVIQFLTLPYIFVSYGLVVVAINGLMLLLLSWLFPSLFSVSGLLWAILGGFLMGLMSSLLESIFGLDYPIVPEINEGEPGAPQLERGPTSADQLISRRMMERADARLAEGISAQSGDNDAKDIELEEAEKRLDANEATSRSEEQGQNQ